MTSVDLRLGDSLDLLPTLDTASVDAVVTDPPYELAFMGRQWDSTGIAYNVDLWRECLRVLRPGGYVAAFGGTRTYHRMACAVEDAGLRIVDSLHWMHGQGFPKGKGQLKPAHEPIVLARKPAPAPWLNVDACRVATGDNIGRPTGSTALGVMNDDGWKPKQLVTESHAAGRWPANVLLSHGACDDSSCEPGCPVAELDRQSGITKTGAQPFNRNTALGVMSDDAWEAQPQVAQRHPGEGGASRFFPTFRYQAKAPASERPNIDGKGWPTVKPLSLMRWLVRLVTPPGGLVLDPFAGTGATLQAAELEGFRALGIERDPFAYQLACQRLGSPESPLTLDLPA